MFSSLMVKRFYLAQNMNGCISDFEKKFIFIIDVYSVYKYIVDEDKLVKVFDLDEIKDKNDIITKIKEAIL